MKLETFTFFPDKGWSVASFPALDSPSTLILVFGAPSFLKNAAPIKELTAAYPQSHIIGCSTAGEIYDTYIYDESLTVAIAKFESTRLASASTQVKGAKDSYRAGESIAAELRAPDLKAVFVLSNGTNINGSELVRALNNNLPEQVVVTGGLAGDGDRFEKTWVINGGGLATDYVCAVGFYGENIRVGHGSKGGWDVFGPQRRVTRSEDNVLFELDGRPALDLYKEYLGALASGLPSSALLFPLSLRIDPNDEKNVVRTILSVNEEQKSLTFAGDVPEGHYAQLMKANFDRLINGASEAAFIASSKDDIADKPTLSIAISCVGRRLVLGERTEEELEATLEVLPKGVQQVGFYSYGEISPYASGSCDLHNQTMTLTTVQEI
jgi:hypothetical protein